MKRVVRAALMVVASLGIVFVAGCKGESGNAVKGRKPCDIKAIQKASFGKTADGTPVDIYTLENTKGAKAKIMTYGGIVVSLEMPDSKGKLEDVVLGYDKLDDYLTNNPYFGCLVGRYGNRIAKGKFSIDGAEFTLATNNDANHLHGGVIGFDKVVWNTKPVETKEGPSLEMSYVSKDMEEGYPGNLSVKAVYTLTENNELKLVYTATTDKKTVLNLTHHSYFNLAGPSGKTILDHEVMIDADRYTPVDEGLIPLGELAPVAGTPFDFTRPKKIGERVNGEHVQLVRGKGYDHNWVLNKKGNDLTVAARVYEPVSGRIMEVLSTEPGLQFYCGNFLNGSNVGKAGKVYLHRYGFCMEPQHYPDSPNQANFPSTLLKPGETYSHTLMYRFSAKD